MKILALDSSAKTASAAITDGEQLISEAFVNAGLTHSETLLPMVDSVLSLARLTMADIDGCVITDGPGSFTGIRIGIAAVKGLAMPNETKCCGVSTLKAMAYNLRYDNCIACCAMDARCSQVYSAIFRCFDGKVERLTEDDAIPASKLPEILEKYANERISLIRLLKTVLRALASRRTAGVFSVHTEPLAPPCARIWTSFLRLNFCPYI